MLHLMLQNGPVISQLVISDLTYSVGKSDNGQVLVCKAVNVAAPSGIQATRTLDVKCKLL